jgi:glycosyltransferase involved in cell wall biosynthesis
MIVGMPTTSFPVGPRDPSGSFVLGMARALATRGHRVEVLAPEPANGTPWIEPAAGVTVTWLPYARPRALERTFHRAGAPENLARDPLAWLGAPLFVAALDLALASRMRRWDAVASHWGVPCGWLVARRRSRGRARDHGRRHIAFFHSGDVHALGSLPIGRAAITRTITGGSDRLVFVSEDLRARFLAMVPAEVRRDATWRSSALAMGIDPLPRLDRDLARATVGARKSIVLTLSRLVPIKGLELAIAAVAGLDGVELVIAGEGPERVRLEREAARARADVRFVGHLDAAGKANWLSAADALLAPSRVLVSALGARRCEGSPTAVLEAMAAGLPIVASDAGGLPAMIASGAEPHGGLLFRPGDVGALRAAIARVVRDPALRERLARGATARASGSSWSERAAAVEALLLGGGSADQGSTRRATAGGRQVKSDSASAEPRSS